MESLKKVDPQIFDAIIEEKKIQFEQIRLIASENYVSRAILEANGSILTNRYTEGYIGKRYYEGQEVIDKIESIAIERAKKLFKMNYANVQSLSGSPANLAIYLACLKEGDKIMGLHLLDGGHLSHGWKVSATGRLFEPVPFHVDRTSSRLDYDAIRAHAIKEQPKMIIAGFSSYPREVDFEKFSQIAKEVNALLLADIAHISALIVGGQHCDPSPYADIIMTTTHKGLRGPRGALILSKDPVIAEKINKTVFPGLQGGSHNHHVASKAICFKEALSDDFQVYAAQMKKNAKVLADELLSKGFQLVTNGTDNHCLLIDLSKEKMSGKVFAQILSSCGIISNANSIPFDPNPPSQPSGVRLGTPATTTLGMKEKDMKQIAEWITKIFSHHSDKSVLNQIKNDVREFCQSFPTTKFIIS